MPETPSNFGDTLSSGIQDVAALLPLLGTEQCERQVGSALEKGYLYAAAASLSLFGSLGIVKVAFATLLATIVNPFYGGRWLEDAGFGTPGSVSSMVTVDKPTGLYGTELKLLKLLEEQHIEDPNMVSGFEWTGWRRYDTPYSALDAEDYFGGGYGFLRYFQDLRGDIIKMDFEEVARDLKAISRRISSRIRHFIRLGFGTFSSWNRLLIVTSALSAVVSLSPYVYLTSNQWDSPLSWIYPGLRSLGSFICIVCIQLMLQLRIHQISNTALAWMKIRRRHDTVSEEHDGWVPLLEERIRIYLYPPSNTEGTRELDLSEAEQQELTALLATNATLVMYQLMLAVGMMMIVAGYIGSFSILSQTDVASGPYVWFAMETALSVIRTILWGLNPSWDEHTRLTMSLQLRSSGNAFYPLITSPYDGDELGFGKKFSSPKPFTVYNEAEFFAVATAWIGPLQRLEANAITLYYAVIAHRSPFAPRSSVTNGERKYLCVTMFLMDSRSYTFLCQTLDAETIEVYLSKLEMRGGSYQVSLGDRLASKNDGFLRSQLFRDVVRHAFNLNIRLFGEPRSKLHLKWTMVGPKPSRTPKPQHSLDGGSLSLHDREYLDLSKEWSFTVGYLQSRLRTGKHPNTAGLNQDELFRLEVLNYLESALCEVYLWDRERKLANVWEGDKKLALQLLPECTYAVQVRIEMEKRAALLRYHTYGWDKSPCPVASSVFTLSEAFAVQLGKVWDVLRDELQNLRTDLGDGSLHQSARNLWEGIRAEEFGVDTITLCTDWPGLRPSVDRRFSQGANSCRLLGDLEEELHHLLLAFSGRPITTVLNASDDHAFTPEHIQRNVKLCALEIHVQNFMRRNQSKDLDLLVYPDQTGRPEKMTTLILRDNPTKYPNLGIAAVEEHIMKNANILFLSGVSCHRPGMSCEQPSCKAVFANRQTWIEDVCHGPSFAYAVGFEACYYPVNVRARGNHIALYGSGGCSCLIYCPSLGELLVTLSVRKSSHPIQLTAILDQSDCNMTVTYQVTTRQTKGELDCVIFRFPKVAQGTGKIFITGSSVWKIHGRVELRWKAQVDETDDSENSEMKE